MELNAQQQEEARRRFEQDIKDVDESDVVYASEKGRKKIDSMGSKIPQALLEMWEDIKLMVSMLGDYVARNYTDTPWATIAAIAGAIAYFVMPLDLIPDFIPVAGYLDDAMVIKLAIDFAKSDLQAYRKWKQSRVG